MTDTAPVLSPPARNPERFVRVREEHGATNLDVFADTQERLEQGIGKMPLERVVQDLAQTCLTGDGTTGFRIDEGKLNDTLELVMGIEPRDHIEGMLAVQMAATHSAMMAQAGRLARCEDHHPSNDSASNAMTKLARTFAVQVEALKRYRSTGQTVTVQHVNVADGGQAIVGHISTGGGGSYQKRTT